MGGETLSSTRCVDTRVISDAEWQAARAKPVTLRDALRSEEPYGQYFKEQVRLELVERFGWERVYEGGLRVFTTIDIDLQKAAEPLLEEALNETEAKRQTYKAFRTAARAASPIRPTVFKERSSRSTRRRDTSAR